MIRKPLTAKEAIQLTQSLEILLKIFFDIPGVKIELSLNPATDEQDSEENIFQFIRKS